MFGESKNWVVDFTFSKQKNLINLFQRLWVWAKPTILFDYVNF